MKITKLIFKAIFVLLFIQSSFAYQINTHLIYSKSMEKNIPATVIVPNGYEESNTNYSVVYALHGYGGDHTNWISRTNIETLADSFNVIIVCPDGAKNSWYFDAIGDKKFQYETHIINELIPFVDQNYKTDDTKNGRFITGLSMGGHGALYLAIRHPQLFSAVASMSGGVDIRTSSHKWELEQRLGAYEQNKKFWNHHTILGMIDTFPKNGLRIMIDCGIKDIFIDDNRSLHLALIKANIPHDYIERPGGHSWNYWNRAIPYHLAFFLER